MKYVIIDEYGKFSIVTSVHGATVHDDRYYRKDQVFWMPPVSTKDDLPLTGNKHGDSRVVLKESVIYTWIETEQLDATGKTVFVGDWVPVIGKYWGQPVQQFSDLPLTGNIDGEIRLVKDQGALFRWDEQTATWSPIVQPADISFWEAPVLTEGDLPSTGNSDGDVRLVLQTNELYRWDGTSHQWFPITAGSYWQPPVETKNDLPMSGNLDGDVRLVKSTNDVYRWDESKSKWIDIHEGLSKAVTPLGHEDLSGDINIPVSYEGYLSDGNNFIKYSAGDLHHKIVNNLPFNSDDIEFGPGDKGILKLYRNNVVIDTLDLENHFVESERTGNQSTVPWYSDNGYIVVTFCGIYENVPYNQYAICHLVFNSSWIEPGDNPDIYLEHETPED